MLGFVLTTSQTADAVPVLSTQLALKRIGQYGGKVRSRVGCAGGLVLQNSNSLAENCDRSLRRGDPVVVHGRLNAQTWTNKAGIEVTSFEVEAVLVGHDLARGTSQFTRTAGAGSTSQVPGDRDVVQEEAAA